MVSICKTGVIFALKLPLVIENMSNKRALHKFIKYTDLKVYADVSVSHIYDSKQLCTYYTITVGNTSL